MGTTQREPSECAYGSGLRAIETSGECDSGRQEMYQEVDKKKKKKNDSK